MGEEKKMPRNDNDFYRCTTAATKKVIRPHPERFNEMFEGSPFSWNNVAVHKDLVMPSF